MKRVFHTTTRQSKVKAVTIGNLPAWLELITVKEKKKAEQLLKRMMPFDKRLEQNPQATEFQKSFYKLVKKELESIINQDGPKSATQMKNDTNGSA